MGLAWEPGGAASLFLFSFILYAPPPIIFFFYSVCCVTKNLTYLTCRVKILQLNFISGGYAYDGREF